MSSGSADDREFAKVFGAGMRQHRKAKGMKQEALSHASGYDDHSIISKIETGNTLPSLAQAYRLAQALQIPLEAFVGTVPPEQLKLLPLAMLAMQWSGQCRADVATFLRLLADLVEMTPQPPATTISRNT